MLHQGREQRQGAIPHKRPLAAPCGSPMAPCSVLWARCSSGLANALTALSRCVSFMVCPQPRAAATRPQRRQTRAVPGLRRRAPPVSACAPRLQDGCSLLVHFRLQGASGWHSMITRTCQAIWHVL